MTNLGRNAALQLPVQKNYKIIKEKISEKYLSDQSKLVTVIGKLKSHKNVTKFKIEQNTINLEIFGNIREVHI